MTPKFNLVTLICVASCTLQLLSPITGNAASYGDPIQPPHMIEESKDLHVLLKQREQQAEALNSLNNTNPTSVQFSQLPPAMANNPAVQTIFKSISHPSLKAAAIQIIKSPHRMYMLYANLGWILIFFIFRSWKLSRFSPAQWLRALFFRFWSTVLLFGVAWVGIPALFLGKPFLELFIPK